MAAKQIINPLHIQCFQSVTPQIIDLMELSNLVGPDWVDELYLIQLPDENETRQIPNLKPPSVKNLVRECNLRLHVPRIPHPSITTEFSKSDPSKTQF
ncbi:hypothetical protein ACTXT7_003482 [Hymenolepis weldensis]